MDKPVIMIQQEMKVEFVKLGNKYVSQIPAIMLADFLKDLSQQYYQVADEQLTKATEEYNKQSEVKENEQ